MRAAVLREVGEPPTVGEFGEPDGTAVDVRVAGCNPVDLQLASGAMGTPRVPSVVGKEGVGVTADGARVYFDSPPDPFGSWAQRFRLDIQRYGLEEAADAWRAQADSPHTKLVVVP